MAHLNALWWLYILGDSALSSSGVSEVDSSCRRKKDVLKCAPHSTVRRKDQQTCWAHLAVQTPSSVRSRTAFIHQGPESRGSKPPASRARCAAGSGAASAQAEVRRSSLRALHLQGSLHSSWFLSPRLTRVWTSDYEISSYLLFPRSSNKCFLESFKKNLLSPSNLT